MGRSLFGANGPFSSRRKNSSRSSASKAEADAVKNPLLIPAILLIGCTLPACQSSRYTASMSLEGNEKQSELSSTVSAAVALNSQSHEAFGKALTLVDRFLTMS